MSDRSNSRGSGSGATETKSAKNGNSKPSFDAPNGKGTSYEHDRVARRRDDRGNPIPFSIAYIPPISGSRDLEVSELRHVIDQVRAVDPLQAAQIGYHYQEKLRSAYERLQDERREVQEELEEAQGRSISLSNEIRPIVEDLERRQEEAMAQPLAKLDELMALLDEAHGVAADRVPETGGSYDPTNPTEDTVIRVTRKAPAVIADFLQLPWGPSVAAFKLPSWLVWLMTIVSGTLIGISLGILAGFIEDLFSDIPMLAFWIVLGQVPAIGIRKAIGWSFFTFSESFYLRQPRRKQISWFLAAILVFCSTLTTAIAVDMHGIFKLAQFQALLSGSEAERISAIVMLCLAAVILLGYAFHAAYDGIICGRNDAIENSIAAETDRDFETRSENRRSQPVVQEALRALNHVRRVMASVTEQRAKVATIALDFADRIAKIEARGTIFPEELSPDQKFRVQDALQNLIGCQLELDAVLASVLGVSRRNGQARSGPMPHEPAKTTSRWNRIRRTLQAR